jgi:hypothetical protein
MPNENRFQAKLIEELKELFPDAWIFKSSPYAPQGWPDVTIVFGNGCVAYLECKKSRNERRQPNQEYYVRKLNEGSFAAFIFPENKEDVLKQLSFWENVEVSYE